MSRTSFRKYQLSLVAIIIVLGGIITSQFSMNRWKTKEVIIWDVICYYSYLPAVIYGDLTLEDPDLRRDFDYHEWAKEVPGKGKVIQMSSGTSYLYAPFFFGTWAFDHIRGAEIDTDAPRYHLAVSLAAIFWLLAGLVFLSIFMRRYFSDLVTAVVVLLLVFATNLFHYSTAEPGMSHVYSFSLFSIFLFLADTWKSRKGLLLAILTGVTFGLLVLVRPSNIVLGLVFLLSGWPSTPRSLVSTWYYLPLMTVMAILPWVPQVLYWKAITGSWFYFSYTDSSFFFTHPHIVDILLSFRKGWFIYTPVVLLAITGLFLRTMPKAYRLAIIVFLVFNTYIVSSWWCWWYGGSFGMRPFIESYAVLALPLGAFLTMLFGWKGYRKLAAICILLVFPAMNLFQSFQYRVTLIHWDSMTWKAYKAVFMKRHFPPDYAQLIAEPDYENARKGLPERSPEERLFPPDSDD